MSILSITENDSDVVDTYLDLVVLENNHEYFN